MNGTGETTFEPNNTTTRAMIVTMLYRLEMEDGRSESGEAGDASFTDLEEGSWYEEAVIWAAENGIVKGYDETTFGPYDPVTREQLAAILYRYNEMGDGRLEMEEASSISDAYTDADQISEWAEEAMRWCIASGIITGMTETTLEPKGNATRAQVATMLMRYSAL